MGWVECREITRGHAAALSGLSYRQIKRVRARYVQSGAAGLVHRNRGRPGNRGADPKLRQSCLELIAEHYADFGPTLIAEKLAERHDTIDDANAFMQTWIQGHSRKFEVAAACEISAHGCVGELDLGAVFAWHYRRCLGADFTVRLNNRWYQIEPCDPMPRPRADVPCAGVWTALSKSSMNEAP